MTLSFNKQNIEERGFEQKIRAGIVRHGLPHDFPQEEVDAAWDIDPKIHSIRRGDRWREGMDIHFVKGNRTKARALFAPILKCTGVQNIVIFPLVLSAAVFVDGGMLDPGQVAILARNDGLTVKEFRDFFWRPDKLSFSGQIIHWTGKTYPELFEIYK